MIPKTIHYCWFGRGEKPAKVQKCIESWKKFCPDYEIIEWNEDNFDIHCNTYVEEAYQNKKYAFVSDVARINALKKCGGIYMDTDVEVFKAFDDILDNRCVLGLEYENWVATSFIACEANHPILDIFLDMYREASFENSDGTLNTKTNVERLTEILGNMGLRRENVYQELKDGIKIFPIEYFSPYDYANCVLEKTENTYCAHWFYVSWLPKSAQLKKTLKKCAVKIVGKENLIKIRNKLK